MNIMRSYLAFKTLRWCSARWQSREMVYVSPVRGTVWRTTQDGVHFLSDPYCVSEVTDSGIYAATPGQALRYSDTKDSHLVVVSPYPENAKDPPPLLSGYGEVLNSGYFMLRGDAGWRAMAARVDADLGETELLQEKDSKIWAAISDAYWAILSASQAGYPQVQNILAEAKIAHWNGYDRIIGVCFADAVYCFRGGVCLPAGRRPGDLSGINLSRCSFEMTIDASLNFRRTVVEHINFAGANLCSTTWSGVRFVNTSFRGARLNGAMFVGCIFDTYSAESIRTAMKNNDNDCVLSQCRGV